MVIDSKEWAYWDDLELHRSIDTHPTVGFSAPFDTDRREMRDTFRPFSYKPFQVLIGGAPIFTGQLIDVTPNSEPGSAVVSCGAYSKAAQLEFNNLPGDLVPFEAAGQSLAQIATRLASIWNVGVVMKAPGGDAFRKVKTRQKQTDTTADHDQKVDDFLVELAKQRGLVRTSDVNGDLVFWQSIEPGNPVARLIEGEAGLVSVAATFNPADYYSEITGFTSTKKGNPGARYTERNQRLSGGILRAHSFKLEDVEKGDGPAAVKAKMARMFANAVSFVVSIPSWRNAAGELWEPNTTITLLAPRAMIYTETEFLIRDVYLKQSNEEQTGSLGLVLPGAFSGAQPDRMPWEE
jgi:prophage tail gpP-like protein